MKTIRITRTDLDKDNKYKKGFIGNNDDFEDCSVEIESGLGYVVFEKGIYVKGSIVAEAGSGIKAGLGIVSLNSWIKAKLKITIDSRCRIVAGCFSFDGAKEVEAQEIEGEIAYGIKKLLPKEDIKIEVAETSETISLNGRVYKLVK